MKLKKHQEIAVDFLASKKRALLADDVGTGKTYSAIATLNRIDAKSVLIVCPNTIKYQWLLNLELAYKNFKKAQIINTTKDELDTEANIIIINYDLIIYEDIYYQFLLADKKFQVCILDEAHRLKKLFSKRTRVLLIEQAIALRSERVYCLTGSPMTDHVRDLFPILYALVPDLIKDYCDYYSFTKFFCGGRQVRQAIGKGGFRDVWVDNGATNTDKLKELLTSFMLRRTLEDIDEEYAKIKDYGDFIHYITPDEYCNNLVKEEAEKIKELGMDNVAEVKQAEKLLKLKEFTSIRNKIGKRKVGICAGKLIREVNQLKKVIIFSYHKKVMTELKEKLHGFNPILISGADSAFSKYTKLKRFCANEEEHKVLIGQIKSMSEGVDGLQFICDHAVFFESSVSPADIHQAKARIKRMGQKNPVSFSFYIVESTIEEKIHKLLSSKSKEIQKVIGKE